MKAMFEMLSSIFCFRIEIFFIPLIGDNSIKTRCFSRHEWFDTLGILTNICHVVFLLPTECVGHALDF